MFCLFCNPQDHEIMNQNQAACYHFYIPFWSCICNYASWQIQNMNLDFTVNVYSLGWDLHVWVVGLHTWTVVWDVDFGRSFSRSHVYSNFVFFGLWPEKMEKEFSPLFVFDWVLARIVVHDFIGTVKPESQSLESHSTNILNFDKYSVKM